MGTFLFCLLLCGINFVNSDVRIKTKTDLIESSARSPINRALVKTNFDRSMRIVARGTTPLSQTVATTATHAPTTAPPIAANPSPSYSSSSLYQLELSSFSSTLTANADGPSEYTSLTLQSSISSSSSTFSSISSLSSASAAKWIASGSSASYTSDSLVYSSSSSTTSSSWSSSLSTSSSVFYASSFSTFSSISSTIVSSLSATSPASFSYSSSLSASSSAAAAAGTTTKAPTVAPAGQTTAPATVANTATAPSGAPVFP